MPLTIEEVIGPPKLSVNAKNIKIGTIFKGVIGIYKGVFLRIYDGAVLLNDPNYIWNESCFTVDNYQEVEAKLLVYV